MIGQYEISRQAEDMYFVEQMSHIAAAAHAPFITSASPQLFGLESVLHAEPSSVFEDRTQERHHWFHIAIGGRRGNAERDLLPKIFSREVDIRRAQYRRHEEWQSQYPGGLEPRQKHSEPHLNNFHSLGAAERDFRRFL